MAREELSKSYYNDIMTNKSWIDTTLSIQLTVADYIAQVFFGKDLTRVVYTNPEYSFRKRIESLSKGVNEKIFFSDLQLPFASYFLSSAPKTTKDVSASEWEGYWDPDLNQRVHFRGTLQDVTVQLFYDRIDDATVAFDLAQVEAGYGYPVRYIYEVLWRNKTLQVPIWITIKDIKAGTDSFNESGFLKQNGLYALRLTLEIETVRLHIHRGLNAVQLPFKWHQTGNIDKWQDGDVTEYYTQKAILAWGQKAWDIDIRAPAVVTKEAEEISDLIKDPNLKPADDLTAKIVQSVVPNVQTVEMITGFFKQSTQVVFNKLKYNEPKTTIDEKGEVTAWFDFIVKPSTYQYWAYTDVYVPSRYGDPITIKNCKDTFVQIDQLHPNSTYTVYFIAHDTSGSYNTIPITFTTPVWNKEILPDVVQDSDGSDLNSSIQKKEPDKPTVIRAKGLIGLSL